MESNTTTTTKIPTTGTNGATIDDLDSETKAEPESSKSVVKTDNAELNNTAQDHEFEEVSGDQDDDPSGAESTTEKADTSQIELIDKELTTNETSKNDEDLTTAELTTAEATTFTPTGVPASTATEEPTITTPKPTVTKKSVEPYKW